jgi:hypothetical protein
MRELPDRPNLDQLRRQARALHREATAGDGDALRRLKAVSLRPTLAAAQLALAREHGYPSWARLKAEVERRRAGGPPGYVIRRITSLEELTCYLGGGPGRRLRTLSAGRPVVRSPYLQPCPSPAEAKQQGDGWR